MADVVQQTRSEKHAHVVDINVWRGLGFEQLLEEMARMWNTPKACSKREWRAPGYTSKTCPSCDISRRR